jgi:hypothetical protein
MARKFNARKLKRGFPFLVSAMSLAGVLGLAAPAIAEAETTTTTAPEVAQAPAGHWQLYYYRNYFYSWQTCSNWGEWAMRGGIFGVTAYLCDLLPGDAKWSISLYYDYD